MSQSIGNKESKKWDRGPVLGQPLRRLLYVLFAFFALLGVNSVYLGSITLLEWYHQQTYQDYFYQYMFLVHLLMGLAIVIPVLLFGYKHWKKARNHFNRRAVKAGYGLFSAALILLVSGLVLTRVGAFEIKEPIVRKISYWAHIITPVLVVWLYVLHRLSGKKIKWRLAASWALVTLIFAVVMLVLQVQDPRKWNQVGPVAGEKYFFPSLARTSSGNFIPAETMMNDAYCRDCHQDVHETWSNSVHRFSSFNNPAYLFSIRETRQAVMERDGSVQASRFCAGCHDPVPFFSGRFDDPAFDDQNDPTGQAGITCTVCHAITHINSPRGNADYTIEEPLHYPFAFAEKGFLKWVNHQLVKAKPEFHKKTFLKPLHKTAEFCSACHKVHLDKEINDYKWIRGQNHYDSFLLSGVSGHGVTSFYYPKQAEPNCNNCHMPAIGSDDFGAKYLDDSGQLKVHDHMFPSANTAIPKLLGLDPEVIEAHNRFTEGTLRVDIFGIREEARIDGALIAPLRPQVPVLEPGKSYLVEVVVRTLKLGHEFTQGTGDSNEIWLAVAAESGGLALGRSGSMAADGTVDPWSHFVNAYVLDREGNRIDRRNAQDIFVPLYNNQIPPGAADVVHYKLTVPPDATGEINFRVELNYRKFDTRYMQYIYGADYVNQLPIMEIASDSISFPVTGSAREIEPSTIPEWQRWNDYGIGLLRKGQTGGSKGQLRQAEEAFSQIGDRPQGPLNLARVYLREGRLEEASAALRKAADAGADWWSVAWFSGLVDKQNGYLDSALANFRNIIDHAPQDRGFDFSKDYRLLNEYAQTLLERAKQERGEDRKSQRQLFLEQSRLWFEQTLKLDPENVAAHFNLATLYSELGDQTLSEKHRQLHARYKQDDNVRDSAITAHRRQNPAADHAAEGVVIYDLGRDLDPPNP